MSDNQINKTNSTNKLLANGDNDTTPMKKNTYNREYNQTNKTGTL